MTRRIDQLARVRLTPADWERVGGLAAAESRSVSNMLGVLVAEAMAARNVQTGAPALRRAVAALDQARITRPERAQKGAAT